ITIGSQRIQYDNGRTVPPSVTLPTLSLPEPDPQAIAEETVAKIERKVIRAGRDAWDNIKRAETFEGWLAIGQAITIGRAVALRASGSTFPNGPSYSRALREWCDAHGFRGMDKQTRYAATELIANLDAITAWRVTLPEHRRRRLVQAASNLRHWRRSLVPRMETNNDVKAEAPRFTIVLQAEPHIDAVRNL